MPIVSISPNTPGIEEVLAARMHAVRPAIKKIICRISGFRENDVIVNLLTCSIRDADPDQSDFVVFIDTCPHADLEVDSNRLGEEVAKALSDEGLGRNTEVWMRFLPGPWYLVKNGAITDMVPHLRK